MGTQFRSRITTLLLVSLLTVTVIDTTTAVSQSLALISKLRGFSTKMQHGNPFTSALLTSDSRSIVSYRRLDAATTEADASNKANEVGASVRKAIKQLRGGSDKFYQDLVTAAKIYMCEQDVKKSKKGPSVRYVSCDADNAYKDDEGNDVKLTVDGTTDTDVKNNYDQGLCEINPDCYWDEILPGDTTRAKVYADAESTMNAKAAEDKIKEWLTGVIAFVIPGIVLGVLSLLTMVFFMICRCCCNRCGGRFPREEGYTCMQKFLPLLFFLLFAIGVIVVSAAAFLYRGTMLSAVDDLFNATSGTLDNGSDWIVRIRTPMQQIAAQVTSSAGTVQVKLDGTDFIDTGVSDITGKLRGIETSANNLALMPADCTVNPNSPYLCMKCQKCNEIGDQAGTAADQVDTTTGPGIKELSNVKKQLKTKLVDISNTVQSSVDTQVETTNTFSVTIDDTKSDVKEYEKKFQDYRDMLGYAIMALFAFALVVIIIGFIGILFGLTPLKVLANIMHIAYFLGFIVLFLTFIISAIALAIGVVLGDACEVTSIFADNWTVPLGDSAKPLDACFQNESLLDVFNLSDKLSFARGGIAFPDLDMTSVLNFDSLDEFTTSMQTVDETAFGFDNSNNKLSDKVADALTAVNSYSTQNAANCQLNDGYTLANVLMPWLDISPTGTSTKTAVDFIRDRYSSKNTNCDGRISSANGKTFACQATVCTFSVFMGEQFQVLVNLVSAQNFVTQLHTGSTDITSTKNTFSTKTIQFNDDINDIKSDLNGNLIKYVGDFEAAMYCTFLADSFWTIYDALCGDLMPAITMIALMLFLCGVFLIPVNVCLIIGVKRLKAHGNGHIMDSEMKFK